ncbi:hypothetical protein KSF73_14470 [Burkholderiaceae bacterium DAT-1]|nr:hypothetical protein [Burkholderiaceae bacterium DAT-1]
MGTLDSREFAQAFPFYLEVGSDGVIVNVGASLQKCSPVVLPGQAFDRRFKVNRPRQIHDWPELLAQQDARCVVVESLDQSHIKLRGSMLFQEGRVLFLFAPVLVHIDQVSQFGLTLNDFPAYDAVADMLLVHRTNQLSLADAQRMADELKRKREQLNLVIEMGKDGVVYLGTEDTIEHASTPFAEMLGVHVADLIGMPGKEVIKLIIDRAHRKGKHDNLDIRLEAGEDVELSLLMPYPRIIKLNQKATQTGGRILYVRDITREAEIDRMKSEFLATTAHELRTPMSSIRGFSELLKLQKMESPIVADMIDTIHRQSERMTELLDELLDLAKIERGAAALQRQPLSLVKLVCHTVDECMATHRDFNVSIDVKDECPEVRADQAALGRIFSNILDNSVKFSPDCRQIDLRIAPESRAGRDGIGVEIKDHGIGMAPEVVNRVFERFYRADASGHLPGCGLGLSVVRELVALHGGEIGLQSQPGKGTRVAIWLPAMAA